MRAGVDRRRVRDYRNLVDEYRHQQTQQQQQLQDSPEQKLVLPVVPSKAQPSNSRSSSSRDKYIAGSEDIQSALVSQIRRMEASMAAQAQTMLDLKQEVRDLKLERDVGVPTQDTVTSLAAHQATEEQRMNQLGSMLRLLNDKIEMLEKQAGDNTDRGERRLLKIESRLNGVMDVRRIQNAQMQTAEDLTSTATTVSAQQSVVDGLQSEVDKATRNSEAGNVAAHAVRDEMSKIGVEFRKSMSSEAASTRAVIAEEGLARQDLGLALERRLSVVARNVQERSEATTQAINERIDGVEVSLDAERQARASAFERTIEELDRRWESIGRLRSSDKEASKSEADAMRAAIQLALAETDKRVVGIQHELEVFREDLTASTAKRLGDLQTSLNELREMASGRIEEIESVLSAEIVARQRDVGKIASRVDDAEERCRRDVVTATNRMTELILRLEEKSQAQFDDCNRRFGSELQKGCRESCEYTDARIRRVKDSSDASIAATSAKLAIQDRSLEIERQKRSARCAKLEEEMTLRSQSAASGTRELRDEVERWREELRSDMAAETAGVSARTTSSVDRIQAERAALDARRQEDLRREQVAAEAHVRGTCTDLEIRLRNEITGVACGLEQVIAATRDGLNAESAASSALSLEGTRRCELLGSETIAREELMCEALKTETLNAVENARKLVAEEASERQKGANVAATEWRRAIAASEVSLIEVIEHRDSRLQTQLVDANSELSDAIVSEGRATRAAARALVEHERAERADEAATSLKTMTDLIAATTARLESTAKGYHDQGNEHIKSLILAESEQRTTLGRCVRQEAEVQAKRFEERQIVASVLRSTVDLVADAAADNKKSQLAREVLLVSKSATGNIGDLSQKVDTTMAAIDARFEVGLLLKQTVDAVADRHAQETQNMLLESASKRTTEHAENLETSLGKIRSDLEEAVINESRKREELGAKLVDETHARQEDLAIRQNVLLVMCRLVDIVADDDLSAERSAAQEHMRRLSSRVDEMAADLTVEHARISTQIAAHASGSATTKLLSIKQGLGTSNAIVALSTEVTSAIDHAMDHEIEARQGAVEQCRELADAHVADAMIRCNENIARTEERIRINIEELKITTDTSHAVLRNDIDVLKKRVVATNKATALASKGTSVARAPAQSSSDSTSGTEAQAPLIPAG